MAVLRGQAFNLIEVISNAQYRDETPINLVNRPLLLVRDHLAEDQYAEDISLLPVEEIDLEQNHDEYFVHHKRKIKTLGRKIEIIFRRAFFQSC